MVRSRFAIDALLSKEMGDNFHPGLPSTSAHLLAVSIQLGEVEVGVGVNQPNHSKAISISSLIAWQYSGSTP
jgi:hypothetical protein